MGRILILLSFILLTSCQTTYKGAWEDKKFYDHLGFFNYTSDSDFEPIWPVNRARLTQRFAPPKNPKHDGIDLAARKNTPILASEDGVVIYAGRRFTGYGKMIIIQHSNKWSTLYAHLNHFKVKQGQKVSRGQAIGGMGRTGRASGVHLHFELLAKKLPIDPLDFLNKPSKYAAHKHSAH